ncbi:DUF488 family protein [Bacteroides fragilis]|uniref:DUF488 domain-containing protein n=1 Tax=Bacteroides fragilis TaxID=817 RepID=UPI000C2A00CF|nr:DUF488 family protein [Bacteroides fragilis]MCE9145838.1 DUF488 family protein [Bacteroides fragilis]MCE9336393.1 DUF488 family protein [Bacteroides fragilis]MCS2489565.1 DUF488 family protein [Bacteroides fragilis]MCS2970492.1 DUF488 family protein [Bacteroides fragilis]MCZ2565805.1 DUF488 family protein [Bacteroides fragilis]
MTEIKIKRVYEDPSDTDGYRVLVDRLWPRGMKKEHLKYDYWAKELTPSSDLRKWFHEDVPGHWKEFAEMYRKELETSDKTSEFLSRIRSCESVTLLYASKEPVYNHVRILQAFLEERLRK